MARAESSKHRLNGLTCQFGSSASPKNAPRHLQPNPHHNVGCQFHVPNAHPALDDRFRDVRLKIRTDPFPEPSRGFRAPDYEARPVGVRPRFFQEFRKGERQSFNWVPEFEPDRRQQLVKALTELVPTAAANSSILWKW